MPVYTFAFPPFSLEKQRCSNKKWLYSLRQKDRSGTDGLSGTPVGTIAATLDDRSDETLNGLPPYAIAVGELRASRCLMKDHRKFRMKYPDYLQPLSLI